MGLALSVELSDGKGMKKSANLKAKPIQVRDEVAKGIKLRQILMEFRVCQNLTHLLTRSESERVKG